MSKCVAVSLENKDSPIPGESLSIKRDETY